VIYIHDITTHSLHSLLLIIVFRRVTQGHDILLCTLVLAAVMGNSFTGRPIDC